MKIFYLEKDIELCVGRKNVFFYSFRFLAETLSQNKRQNTGEKQTEA